MNKVNLVTYIQGLGAPKVARAIGVEVATVYYWAQYKTCPRPIQAAKLIEISLGLLSWESIYQPYIDHINAVNENPDDLDFE